MGAADDPPVMDPKEFDRMMDQKVLAWGSKRDSPCPKCHEIGFRMIADSEMLSLFACRQCGYQTEELHEPREVVQPPFREYREGRGFAAAVEDSDPTSASEAKGDSP